MGLMQRNKGKRGEREVISILQPVVDEVYSAHGLEPPKLKRNQNQSDGGGYDIVGLDFLALEVKYHERAQVLAWWRQAERQAGPGQLPVLFWRSNGLSWRVCMNAQIGFPSGSRTTLRVTVDTPDFCDWLRVRIHEELSK